MAAHALAESVVAVVGATGALGSRLAVGASARGAQFVLVGRHEARLRSVLDGAAGVVAFGPLVDTPDVVLEELFLTNVVGPLFLRCRGWSRTGRATPP
jgi:NAD(P)-dependent dehydrogenase (short-subunit alcohol dehydrogenase family)